LIPTEGLALYGDYTLPTLTFGVYGLVTIPVELQTNLSYLDGVFTVVRPASDAANLSGSVSVVLSVNAETSTVNLNISIIREEVAYLDFETSNVTGLTTSYLAVDPVTYVNPVVGGVTVTGAVHRVAWNTSSVANATKALVISPRTGNDPVLENGIAFAEFRTGTDIVDEIEFDLYYWSSSAEQYFTKIELQVKVDGSWVTVENLLDDLAGKLTIEHFSFAGLSCTEFRIYTEGGKSEANDARVLIDNLRIFE